MLQANRIDNMILKRINIIILLFGILALFSCSDDPCNIDTEPLLKLSLTVNDEDLTANGFTDGLSIFSPEWTDSINYWEYNADSVMLSPNNTFTELIFTSTKESLVDTLIIYHKNDLRLLSMECGFIIDFDIDSATCTYNLIDSIAVIDNKITNEESGLIEIYYL